LEEKKYSVSNLTYEKIGASRFSSRVPNNNPLPPTNITIRSLSDPESSEILGYAHSSMLSAQFTHFYKESTGNDFNFKIYNSDEFLNIFSIAGIGYNLLFFMDGTNVSIGELFSRRAKNFKRIELALDFFMEERTAWHMSLVYGKEKIPDTEREIEEKYLHFLEKHIAMIQDDIDIIRKELITLSAKKQITPSKTKMEKDDIQNCDSIFVKFFQTEEDYKNEIFKLYTEDKIGELDDAAYEASDFLDHDDIYSVFYEEDAIKVPPFAIETYVIDTDGSGETYLAYSKVQDKDSKGKYTIIDNRSKFYFISIDI